MIAKRCRKKWDRWMTTEWPYDNREQSTKMLARVFVDDRRDWHPWIECSGFLACAGG